MFKLISCNSRKTLEDSEREEILNTLNYFQGNKARTARALGISVRGLRNKLKKYLPSINL